MKYKNLNLAFLFEIIIGFGCIISVSLLGFGGLISLALIGLKPFFWKENQSLMRKNTGDFLTELC